MEIKALEPDIKKTLIFLFDEHIIDDDPCDIGEIEDQALAIAEDYKGCRVNMSDPLIKAITKELSNRLEKARKMYQSHITELKESI